MHRTTPNWDEISNLLIFKLDDLSDDLAWVLDNGEDPLFAVTETIEELKHFISAIENNPEQFSMKDVS